MDKGVVSYAYRAGPILVQKDKITSISQIDGSLRFDATGWQSVTDPLTFPRSDFMGDLFVDSRGIIYAGGVRADYVKGAPADTAFSYIFESTDGLHFTPVQPFVDLHGKGLIWNFTEDKYGNVWAGEYTDRLSTTGDHLWRRTPDGTWTNVANWTDVASGDYHIHNVYYDPVRDALYVAIGDRDIGILKLPSDKINASSLSASDFSYIVPTFSDESGAHVEATALTSDANYLYAGLDMHTDWGTKTRAIARITDNGTTQTIEAVYPLAGCAVWHWGDVDDQGNVIFSSIGINEWGCTTNYENKIVASSDQGATWQVLKDFGSTSTSLGLAYTGMASHYATNWSGLYGGGNGWGGPSLRAFIGRAIPTNSTFYVNGMTGVDWTNFGLSSSNPVKSLTYLQTLDIQPGDTVQFTGSNSYTEPLMVNWSGNGTSKISLQGAVNSTLTGGNIANTPAVAETFEGTPGTWNFTYPAGGVPITADTSIVHGGAQSAKVEVGAAQVGGMELKKVPITALHEGDTAYLSYWVYYPNDQTSDTDPIMVRFLDSIAPTPYELRLQRVYEGLSNTNLPNEIVLNIPAHSHWYIPAQKSLTSATWHKIYIEDYLDPNNGSLKMYVDNILALDVTGIKTITAGESLNQVMFYNQLPITYYVDDLKFGKLPLEARGAINTNGFDYLDIGNFRFQGTNGAMITAASTNIDVHDSIFNGLTNNAITNISSSNINLYYNTIYGSGQYGIYSTGDATLKNNVVYSSGVGDVFAGSGTTLTGSYNWFEDAAVSGPGTYTNAGSTTWSGSNPRFVNPLSGSFQLLANSPLIDHGTPIPGFTHDFVGTVRPQGDAPDIGAYESTGVFAPYSLWLPFVTR